MPLSGRGRSGKPELRRTGSNTGGRLFAALVMLSLALFTFSVRENGSGPLTTAKDFFQVVVSPLRYGGTLLFRPLDGLGNIFSNLTADQQTLTELEEENRYLRAKNAELMESAGETERLQALLDLKSTYSLEGTAAHVISGSADSWTDTVTIDKGSTSGIAVGMPVTDTVSVIGQVISCGPTTATVRLISDENSGVSAMVQSSRAQGILKGSADGSLHLTLIRADQSVSVGDTVITSGLGGSFPKGLLLGRVTSVEKTPGSLYYEVSVERMSSVESYEEVLVITQITAEQQASAEDIAEADAQETEGLKDSSTETTDGAASAESPLSDSDAEDATEGEW